MNARLMSRRQAAAAATGAAGIAALVLSGCSLLGSAPAEAYPVQATALGVTPEFEIEVSGEVLAIDYTLDNAGEEPVIVVDQLPEVIGMSDMAEGDVDPRLAYVGAVDDRTVRVSRQVFGLGDDSGNREVQPVVGGTRVEPGEEHTGTIEVPLPVQARAPGYSTPNFSDRGLHRSERLQVCLGVLSGADVEGADGGGDDGGFVQVPVNQQDQVLVCSPVQELPEGVSFA